MTTSYQLTNTPTMSPAPLEPSNTIVEYCPLPPTSVLPYMLQGKTQLYYPGSTGDRLTAGELKVYSAPPELRALLNADSCSDDIDEAFDSLVDRLARDPKPTWWLLKTIVDRSIGSEARILVLEVLAASRPSIYLNHYLKALVELLSSGSDDLQEAAIENSHGLPFWVQCEFSSILSLVELGPNALRAQRDFLKVLVNVLSKHAAAPD